MQALDTWGTLRPVGSDRTADRTARGKAIRERFDSLGISQVEFHTRTGIAPQTLTRVFSGDPKVRPQTIDAVEVQLDKLEQLAGMSGDAVQRDLGGGVVAIVVEGLYGARTITVKGPVENIAELEKTVANLLRSARNDEGGDSPAASENP